MALALAGLLALFAFSTPPLAAQSAMILPNLHTLDASGTVPTPTVYFNARSRVFVTQRYHAYTYSMSRVANNATKIIVDAVPDDDADYRYREQYAMLR